MIAELPAIERFASDAEAQAWAVFFAAQCPHAPTAREREVAAASADEMLAAWRERARQT